MPFLTHIIHHHFFNNFSCDNIYLGKKAGKDVDHQSLDLPECQAIGTAVPSHNKKLCVLSTRMLSGGCNSRMYHWWILCTLYNYTRMPGESYRKAIQVFVAVLV